MAKVSKTRVAYRGPSGKFITEKAFKRADPEKVVKERLPNPGHGLGRD